MKEDVQKELHQNKDGDFDLTQLRPEQENFDLTRLDPEQEDFDSHFFLKDGFDLDDEELEAGGLWEFDLDFPGEEEDGSRLDRTLNAAEPDEDAVELSDSGLAEAVQDCFAEPEKEECPPQDSVRKKVLLHLLSASVSAACIWFLLNFLLWFVYQVHPDFQTYAKQTGTRAMAIFEKLETYVEKEKKILLCSYSYDEEVIQKIYKISEDATDTYEPNPDGYGSISYEETEKVEQVIQKAREYGLLGEEEAAVFDPDADFYARGEIKYYLDETILVLCWKEYIDGKVVSMMEVKLKDASQFRRKLTGDTYGSGIEMFCTQLAGQTNAVAACNADYYAFRNLGLSCNDGKVCRYGQQNYAGMKLYNCLDTLFIDGNGDFQYFERGTEATQEEIEAYMDEIGASFSLSFGPILVKHGEAQYNDSYPIGQITELYSRAGIGQVGTLHYIYMVISNSGKGSPRATTDGFADIMLSKGAYEAYNLDGGQTGEYVFQGSVESLVDFGSERTVSDIIYFGSALPEEDWQSFQLED